jgi:uncharacterized repeat protein (TIGR03803 family)
MNRPAGRAVITTDLLRYGVSLSAVAVLLAGCGGSQPPLSVSPQGLAPQQLLAQRAYHIVHPFGRSEKDGTHPAADLIDVGGRLYGTTVNGGSNGAGTVYSITTSGEETVLHHFGHAAHDGRLPMGRLLNVNGTLYGTTAAGGTNGGGTVFSISLSGAERVVHNFPYLGNGVPEAGLIDVDGTLYGTTGGLQGYWCGEVFSLTLSGKFKRMHYFGRGADGCAPLAPLLNVNGTLYGTTSTGGNIETGGTVFTIKTTGQYKTLYNFGINPNDGEYPTAALINVQGTLYGTTRSGGSGDRGTVFSITTGGSENIVYSFAASGSNGSSPVAALKNVKGVFYGTTQGGGANNLGTVYKVTKSGVETVLKSFAKGDGISPATGVIAVGGTLYGTTFGSNAYKSTEYGNVFSLMP